MIQDENKTKAQLIEELATLRQRNAELESVDAERKKAEEMLRASEERYRRLFQDAVLGIFQSTPDGKAITVNDAFARMFGYESPDEVKTMVKNVATDIFADPNRWAEILRLQQEYPDLKQFENLYRRKDGSTFTGNLHVWPVTDEAGHLLRLEGFIEDITARKLAEGLLRMQRDLSMALSLTSDLTEVSNKILDVVLQIEGLDCGGIYLVDAHTGTVDLICHRGLSAQFVERAGHLAPDAPQVRLLMTRKTIYGSYHEIRTTSDPTFLREGLRAGAIIPVVHEGQVIAALNMSSHTHDEIPLSTRNALEAIAAHIGGAIVQIRTMTALRESQQNLETLFHGLEDLLFIIDATGRIVHWNQVVERRLGYSPTEVAHLTVLSIHPPDRRAEVAAIITDILVGKREMCVIPLMTKAGTQIPVETRVTRGTWDNQPVLFGISRDITERKRAEDALRESEERYRRITHAVTDYIYTVHVEDHRAVETWHGEGCIAVTGYASEEFAADPYLWYRMVADEDRPAVEHQARQVLTGENVPPLEHRIVRKDGAMRWVRNTPVLHRDEAGRLLSYDGLVQDITERKHAEEALVIKDRAIASVMNGMAIGEFGGNLTYVNRSFLRLWGYDDEKDVLGKPATSFWRSEEQAAQVIAELTQNDAYVGELVAKRKDGSLFDVQLAASMVRDKTGKPLCMMGSFLDITERKWAEEEIRQLNAKLEQRVRDRTAQLEATNKELESFAYVVSHDLKAPLRGINQLAHWLVEDYANAFDEKGKEMIDLLIDRVKRMDILIEGILQYSRIGRIEGKGEPIDLNLLVRDVIDLLAAPEQIHISIEHDLPVVAGDQTRMVQVFQNLVGNAMKFMDKPQGEITIGCVDEGTSWKFSVADNGPGIDPKHHEKIFQIFQTLQPRDKRESTGVGLATVKKIVELYGGKIWVESKPGKGSTFFFTLPKKGGQP
jgi:PAS domain S-box-containing protein